MTNATAPLKSRTYTVANAGTFQINAGYLELRDSALTGARTMRAIELPHAKRVHQALAQGISLM
jgi:hypothetical protein